MIAWKKGNGYFPGDQGSISHCSGSRYRAVENLFGGFTLINFEGIHMAHEFPPDELELLMYLVMNPHKAFPAAVLSALVWSGADPGTEEKSKGRCPITENGELIHPAAI